MIQLDRNKDISMLSLGLPHTDILAVHPSNKFSIGRYYTDILLSCVGNPCFLLLLIIDFR